MEAFKRFIMQPSMTSQWKRIKADVSVGKDLLFQIFLLQKHSDRHRTSSSCCVCPSLISLLVIILSSNTQALISLLFIIFSPNQQPGHMEQRRVRSTRNLKEYCKSTPFLTLSHSESTFKLGSQCSVTEM